MQSFKLFVRVHVLPSGPLHELLIVDFLGDGHLEVSKCLFGGLYCDGWVIKVREEFIVVLLPSLDGNFEHVIYQVEYSLDERCKLIEAHSARVILIEKDEGCIDLVRHGASAHDRHTIGKFLGVHRTTPIGIE